MQKNGKDWNPKYIDCEKRRSNVDGSRGFIWDTNKRVNDGWYMLSQDITNWWKNRHNERTRKYKKSSGKTFHFIDIARIILVIGVAYLMLFAGLYILFN